MEASISQSMAYYDESKHEFKCAVYMDESERKFLDFNVKLSVECMKLLDAVNVLKPGRLVIGGASEFYNVVFDVGKKAAPRLELGKIVELIKSQDVEEMVENADDVPEFWFDDGEGKPYLATDRRNVWCYERCLSDENRITQRDLFNPGPWPHEEVDYDNLKRKDSVTDSPKELETIEENDEEGEW